LDDAEKVAQDIESTAGKDGDTAYVCARIAVDRGNKDKAKQLLETALKHKKAFMYQSDAEELLSQLKQ
jgi:hypothetical protein